MAVMWMSVLVLLPISASLVQRVSSATAFECSILTGKDTTYYLASNYACCQNAYFAVMQTQCCTRSTQCLCNPNYNYGSMACITGAAPPTVAISSPTTTKAASVPLSSTTSSAATTTTTAKPTTTPAPVHLCPATFTGRLLSSTAVLSTSCIGSGTVGFEITNTGESLCNGALIDNLATGAYDVYTVTSCVNRIIMLLSSGTSVSFLVGTQRLPMDACAIKDATFSDPLSSIVLHPIANFVMETVTASCVDTGCAYNRTSMKGAIDWRKCYVTSYGATELTSSVGGKLTSILVQQSDIAPCLPAPAGIQCFEAVTTGTACQDLGDDGAPVYCSLNTGEYVLYGLAYVTSCRNGNTFFSVHPWQLISSPSGVGTTPGDIVPPP